MTKSGAGSMRLEDLTNPKFRSPDETLENMIESLITLFHDKLFTEEKFTMIYQIPITHQIKCFLDKSFKTLGSIKECIGKINKADLALDHKVY